jgi:transposase
MESIQFINAIMYVAENGCKWRSLPKEYGNWHSVYVRMNRWSKRGVLARCLKTYVDTSSCIGNIIKKDKNKL